MALVLKRIYLGYSWLFDELADTRSAKMGLFLMSSPLNPVLIVTAYLYFVLKLGPRLMQNRKPFDLKNVIIVYNILQIALNLYIVYEASLELWYNSNWDCDAVDYSETPKPMKLIRTYHLFFLIKMADLLDTVFFVLRKKQRQISFLHLYHHFGMFLMLWVAVKFFPGGHGTWIGLINGSVHAIMYFYYLLSALDDKWKQSIPLKKSITLMQMTQFTLFIVIYGRLLFKPDCAYPKLCSYFFVPQNCFMLILFGDFYRRAYLTKRSANTKRDW